MANFLKHDYHGGGCCGIEHISGFGNRNSTEPLVKHLKSLQERATTDNNKRIGLRLFHSNRKGSLCLEVTVTDKQLQRVGEALKTAGFKRVARFPNPNSQNHVNIFYWHPDLETFN